MRLLYLYCKSINDSFKEPLDGLDLNFDSEWRFEYVEGVLYVKHGTPLPKEFFSSDDGKVDVSVVVGCNGAGKTSIARIIHRLSIGDANLGVLIVCEDNGVFSLVTARMDVEVECCRQNIGAETSGVIDSLRKHTHKIDGHILREGLFKFVYYSPVYTAQHQMDVLPKVAYDDVNRFFYDISTSSLMRDPDRFRVGRDQPNEDNWVRFEKEDARCVWQFLCERRMQARKCKHEIKVSDCNAGCTDELIPRLKAVTVSINESAQSFIECEYRERLKEYKESYAGVQKHEPLGRLRSDNDELIDEKEKFCQSVVGLFDRKDRFPTFAKKSLFAYAVCRWYDLDCGIKEAPTVPDINLLRLLDYIAANSLSDMQLISFVSSFIGDASGRGSAVSGQENLGQFMGMLVKYSADNAHSDSVNKIIVTANKPGGRTPILPIAEMHLRMKTLTDFLVLMPEPKVSSGEWSLLCMLGRIYALKSRLRDSPAVLFLDEVETTLHPDLQRRLVAGIVDFCERFLPDNHVHVIFATHSPQLLSDIPKGNVILLRRSDDDKRSIAEMTGNTFGANVYDLLKDGFFMENGAVGEFATRKIGGLLRSIVECRVHEAREDIHMTERQKMAKIVGDRVLCGYFKRLESIGKL